VRLVGYVRVSTDEQSSNGSSLTVQADAIGQAARERGWQLVRVEEEVVSGGLPLARRPVLDGILRECEDGQADGLVVTSSTASLAASSRGLASSSVHSAVASTSSSSTRRSSWTRRTAGRWPGCSRSSHSSNAR
jgi:hypothetical protein